jgi:hypothetical protein
MSSSQAGDNLPVRETPALGIHIPGITEKTIHSIEDFQQILEETNRNSLIWQTFMSSVRSSRMGYLYRVILENIPNSSRPEFPTVINFVILQGENPPEIMTLGHC